MFQLSGQGVSVVLSAVLVVPVLACWVGQLKKPVCAVRVCLRLKPGCWCGKVTSSNNSAGNSKEDPR